MEITNHSVTIPGDDSKVTISLEGICKQDMTGTNLELTGQGNWFGSLNMCNMLADNSACLFPFTSPVEEGTPSSDFAMLELGSGLGRAGLMALKLIERGKLTTAQSTLSGPNDGKFACVLTDGEEEIVSRLSDNYVRNFPGQDLDCRCEQLWWGDDAQLRTLTERHPAGFDLIIGADLIYGRDAAVDDDATVEAVEGEAAVAAPAAGGFGRDKMQSVLYTVSKLLSRRTEGPQRPQSQAQSCSAPTATAFEVGRRPAFFLAVTRRELLPLEELRAAAGALGLAVDMLEDYTIDIFDASVDVESVFWRDTILHVYRI